MSSCFCTDCDWAAESGGFQEARRHVKESGHLVEVSTAAVTTYGPKGETRGLKFPDSTGERDLRVREKVKTSKLRLDWPRVVLMASLILIVSLDGITRVDHSFLSYDALVAGSVCPESCKVRVLSNGLFSRGSYLVLRNNEEIHLSKAEVRRFEKISGFRWRPASRLGQGLLMVLVVGVFVLLVRAAGASRRSKKRTTSLHKARLVGFCVLALVVGCEAAMPDMFHHLQWFAVD